MANLGVKDAKNTVPASSVADGPLVRFGLTLSTWSERWFPDPLVFALAGVVLVFIFGVIIGQKPGDLAYQGGKAFWTLVPFTMQMVMIIIGGYVVATAPIVNRFIAWISTLPKNPRTAIAVVAFLSMLTSLISWGLSLIFSGLLVRELAKRVKGMDIRAAGAAGYLGLGAVWALGLSSSAAMMMATKSSIPAGLYQIAGVIPLKQTLFLWQGLATAALLIVLSTIIAYASAPGPGVYSTRFGLLTPDAFNGNVPRNLGTMPTLVHIDTNLSRAFKLGKADTGRTLTLNARAANLLNHTNFTTPNAVVFGSGPTPANPGGSTVVSPTAGVETATATTSRQLQFVLKLLF